MRKLNCSRRSLSSSSPRSLGAFARKSFAFMFAPSRSDLALDERGGHRELRRRKTERLARDRLGHALDLEQHLARQHLRHPIFDVALARTHAHFERLLGNGHIREHADPNTPAALHIAGDRAARRFNLARSHAGAIGGLEAELAERHGIAALRTARDLALELFAELGPLRLHHAWLPNQVAAGAAVSAGLAPAAAAPSASVSSTSSAGLSNTSPLKIQTLMPITP